MQRGMVSGGVAADTKGLLRSGKLQLRIIMLYILQRIWVELICVWMRVKGLKPHTTNTVNRYLYFCRKSGSHLLHGAVTSVSYKDI